MDNIQRQQLIDRYEQGAHLFSEALGSVPAALLDTPPAPGKWSIRQIAVHTADAEVVVSGRFRAIAGEDGSAIQAFNQDQWATGMNYQQQPIEHTQAMFVVLRHANAAMLRALPEAAWNNRGIHSERGAQSLEDLLNLYVKHGENHSRAIQETHQKISARKSA